MDIKFKDEYERRKRELLKTHTAEEVGFLLRIVKNKKNEFYISEIVNEIGKGEDCYTMSFYPQEIAKSVYFSARNRGSGTLSNIIVKKEYQRRGFADLIIAQILDYGFSYKMVKDFYVNANGELITQIYPQINQLPMHEMSAKIREHTAMLVALYEKHGFRLVYEHDRGKYDVEPMHQDGKLLRHTPKAVNIDGYTVFTSEASPIADTKKSTIKTNQFGKSITTPKGE